MSNLFGWNINAQEFPWNEGEQILIANESASDLIMNDWPKAANIAEQRLAATTDYVGISRADFPDDDWRKGDLGGMVRSWQDRAKGTIYNYWPNEPLVANTTELTSMLSRCIGVMNLSAHLGVQYAIGNFSQPVIRHKDIDGGFWDRFLTTLSDTREWGVLGAHDYTSYLLPFGAAGMDPRRMIGDDVNPDTWPTKIEVLNTKSSGNWHLFRWYWLIQRLIFLELPLPRVVVTEGLWDRMPNYNAVAGTNVHQGVANRYNEGRQAEGVLDQMPIAGRMLNVSPEKALELQLGWYEEVAPDEVLVGVNLFTISNNTVWTRHKTAFNKDPRYIQVVADMARTSSPIPQPQPEVATATIEVGTQNIRSESNVFSEILGTLSAGSVATLVERTSDNQWVAFQWSESRFGWLYTPILKLAGPVSSLAVAQAPAPVPVMGETRLGFSLHHTNFDDTIRDLKSNAVLTLVGSGHARKLAAFNNNVIHRFWPDHDVHKQLSPQQFVTRHANLAPAGIIVHTNNEPAHPNNAIEAAALVSWHLEVIRLSAPLNLRLCILNFGAGAPDIDKWHLYHDLLVAVGQSKGRVVMGIHEYMVGHFAFGLSPNTNPEYIWGTDIDKWPKRTHLTVEKFKFYRAGRYKHLIQYCLEHNIIVPDIYITEFGFDEGMDGRAVAFLTDMKRTANPDAPHTHYSGWRTLGAIYRYWWPNWSLQRSVFEQYTWALENVYWEPQVKALLAYAITDDPKWEGRFDYEDADEYLDLLDDLRDDVVGPPPPPVIIGRTLIDVDLADYATMLDIVCKMLSKGGVDRNIINSLISVISRLEEA